MSLYQKYRPDALNKVVGQPTAVATLRTYLEQNTVPHALLLAGNSGCGKTSIGRILKKELNCSDNDYVEMNCADVRGIDGMRDIIRNSGFAPVGGSCRIWLLDECALLTKEAQSTMLKMLEDAPKHVYFILCTTDPQKLLPTIKTRCTEIKLNPLSHQDLCKLMKRVVRLEEKSVPEEVIEQIATDAAGSARMALVLLDKIIDLPETDMAEAAKQQAAEESQVIELCRKLINAKSGSDSDLRDCLKIIKQLQDEPESIRYAILGYAKSIMLNGKDLDKCYLIINAFKNNFYDSKMAGVCAACYEVILGN